MNTFYFFCAIFGSAFILLQFCLLLFAGIGADSDGSFETDTGTDMEVDSGSGSSGTDGGQGNEGGSDGFSSIGFLKMLSLRTITAGLGFFGFAGLAADSAGISKSSTLIIAVISGLLVIVLVYYLFRMINAFQYSGSIQTGSQIGCCGTVTIRIPPKRTGVGRVQVIQQDRTMEYEAVTDSELEIISGSAISIVKVISSTQVVVEKINN